MDQTLYILMVNHKPVEVSTVLKKILEAANGVNKEFNLDLSIPKYNTISQALNRNSYWETSHVFQKMEIHILLKSIV